jgi:hypothetical protein
MSRSIGSEWLRDCIAGQPSLASHYRPSKVFLRKQENVDFYHEVGQIYENELPYFDEFESLNRDVPEGFIVFMSENPARMHYSVSYSGGRVGSLGNISLALLRQKCAP